jgi:sulfane dehydrogenase subunit SoxC
MTTRHDERSSADIVAGNGLLHRRVFLSGALAGAGGLGLLSAKPSWAQRLEVAEWMQQPGAHMSAYGQPSRFEENVQRIVGGTPGVVGSGISFTPFHALHGTITPNSLHFERHHSGVPDIDPAADIRY